MGDNLVLSNENNTNNVISDNKSLRKTKSSMNIIKVALYMLKKNKAISKKSKSSLDLPNATNATISRLVGSVRPLHLQDGGVGGQSPPPPLPPFSPQLFHSVDDSSTEWGEIMAGMPQHMYSPSPLHSSSSYSSISQASCSSSPSNVGSSHYTSAQSLYDLDDNCDEEISCDTPNSSDAYFDGIEGDEMIDSKADMFIAKMYQQMRIQDI